MKHDVIGAAIEVHTTLGPGFLESTYEKALSIELNLRQIDHETQAPIALSYKGFDLGHGRMDLLIKRCLVVELKTVDAIHAIHKAQVISYLKATGLSLGLLINFNVEVLRHGIKRVILSR